MPQASWTPAGSPQPGPARQALQETNLTEEVQKIARQALEHVQAMLAKLKAARPM